MAKKRGRSTIAVSDDLASVDVASMPQTDSLDNEDLDELLAEESKAEEKTTTKILPSSSNAEMKEKIETLEKHCVELEEANAKLSDSINTYLEEIDVLKKKSSTTGLDASLKNSFDAEIAKLKKELKELRQENDDYLIKISELTFENAKMTSRLQEIEKQAAMTEVPTHGSPAKLRLKPSTATMPNQPQFANPYLQNGYQDW